MEKKVIRILLMVCLVLTVVVGGCARSETSSPPEKPTPQTLLDFDGDGFSDWFEVNIAHYNPEISNDRYVILYDRSYNEPNEDWTKLVLKPIYEFFVEKAKIPPEDIIELYYQEANGKNLRNAIDQIAQKSDENDIVFIRLSGHGGKTGVSGMEDWPWIEEAKRYSYHHLHQQLFQIKAKAVVITVMACESFFALPVLKEGTPPRIVFVNTAGEFVGALGKDPEYAEAVDRQYGNGNGYVSIGEIGKWLDNYLNWDLKWEEFIREAEENIEKKVGLWLDNDPNWRTDWEKFREEKKHLDFMECLIEYIKTVEVVEKPEKLTRQEFIEYIINDMKSKEEEKRIFETNGNSVWTDSAGIAFQIYLTDYKIPD